MSKHFLVFQHTKWEGPGQFLCQASEKCAIDLSIVKLWKDKIPPLSPYDGLIVLGGKPNVHQEAAFPYLKEEKRTIIASLKEDRPYLGICLGHQLLADALGATVGDNYCASIGFVEGFQTRKAKKHPLFNKIPQRFPLFKWHSQSVTEPVPRNLDILATSAECQVEAISVKGRPHIIGMQFDNNSSAVTDVQTYLREDQQWLSSLNAKYINPDAIIHDAEKHSANLSKQYNTLLSNFVKMS